MDVSMGIIATYNILETSEYLNYNIYKCSDVLSLHACIRAVHKLSRCLIRIAFYREQCAEWNADVLRSYCIRIICLQRLRDLCGHCRASSGNSTRATVVASILMCHVWLLAHEPKTNDAIFSGTSSGVSSHIFSLFGLGELLMFGQYSVIAWDLFLHWCMSEIYFTYAHG